MSDEPLPGNLKVCHELIRHLRGQLSDANQRLAEYEARERREFERMYGKGATPQSLLGFGLLLAGKGGAARSPDPDNPTCGELYLREKAAQRAAKRQARQKKK
jgi:hypothetical protein